MKFAYKFSSFTFAFICLLSISLFGQKAEDVITESSEPANEKYLDGIVQKTLIAENRVIAYEPIREADIAWEKRMWRIIDTREKINLPFRYPQRYFFTVLQDLAKNGDIALFKEDDFGEQMTTDELDKILNRVDTVVVWNEDTYEEEVKITRSELNPAEINRYRLKEIWFFDEETSTLRVRILGIAPIKEEYDPETGVFKYEAPLFWVYMPEAREYLAKHTVFNDFNDNAPKTWHDVFEERYFASYIYKQSNVLDVRLKDMFFEGDNAGIDLLLESEKLKAELYNFEHDLWEY
jgi:gliding motility associated protien GldN